MPAPYKLRPACQRCGRPVKLPKRRFCSYSCSAISRYPPKLERFWAKVTAKDPHDCWDWTGATKGGYGVVRWDGPRRIATHISWSLVNGPIPDGFNVLHHCDRPSCVNPRHLWLGTQKDNAQDAKAKGRLRHPTVLTEAQVREIRASKEFARVLGPRYGVSKWTIYDVRSRHSWAHVI